MQRDECKCTLLCIANMCIGLTPLNRIQDKYINEHVWSTPHNAVITHYNARITTCNALRCKKLDNTNYLQEDTD